MKYISYSRYNLKDKLQEKKKQDIMISTFKHKKCLTHISILYQLNIYTDYNYFAISTSTAHI